MWMWMRMRTNMLIVVVVVATLTSMSDCAPASDRRQDAEADERISFAVQYLQQYGYLSKVQNVFTEDEFSNALELFNQNSGVAALRGPGQSLLDDVTFSKMKEPRCGVADIQRDEFQNPQLALNGVAEMVNLRDRWFKCEVTWRVLAGDNRRSDDELRMMMDRALEMWETAANSGRDNDVLRLRAARDDEETADINLGFFRRYHGDPVPFDGSGGTYAHAFFPVSGGNLRGRIHFDRDEDWNVNGFPGRVMNYTMLHELGHTLGLYHSTTRNSVMYAFLTGSARFKEGLQDDDMRRINMLYARNACPPREQTTFAPVARTTSSITDTTDGYVFHKPRLTTQTARRTTRAPFRPNVFGPRFPTRRRSFNRDDDDDRPDAFTEPPFFRRRFPPSRTPPSLPPRRRRPPPRREQNTNNNNNNNNNDDDDDTADDDDSDNNDANDDVNDDVIDDADDNLDVEVPNARLPKESVPTRRPAPRIPTSPRRRITPVRSLEPTDDNAPGATLPKPRSTLSNTDVDQRPTFYKIHCYTGRCVKKFYRG